MLEQNLYTIAFSTSLTSFAAEYDCGAYGAGLYGEGEGCETTTTTPATNTGNLVDTGSNFMVPIAIGAALVLAVAGWVVIKLVRKRKR